MKVFILKISVFLLLTSSICTQGQTNAGFDGDDYLKYEDYNRALIEFLKLYKTKKEDPTLNTKIGLCYLHVNDDKTKAIPYLEFVHSKGNYPTEIINYLGMAYMYAYRFDDAIKFFNDYKTKAKLKNNETIDRYITNCNSAKELVKKPVNVSFENLGKEINSKYPDYNPFVTKDQGTLYFTSGRDTNPKKILSSQGFFTTDIYFSKVKDGEWTKAKNIGNTINSIEDEQCVYVTPDGKSMLLNIDNEVVFGDLYITDVNNTKFSAPIPFNNPVNTEGLELEGCISNDASFVIISSKREGGLGETDLYMLKRLPNGEWGLPINLGSNINTPYKEAFPRFDETTNTLYFSSEGHQNMGGFDIFKASFNPETNEFGKAENMGYPINTPDDNMQFSLAGNKRDGYISACRKEGLGDLDIYKLIFNDVEVRISVIKGIVAVKDSANKTVPALVTVFNKKTNKKVEAKNASPKTGKYVFAVEPGKYQLTVSSPGFQDFSQEITIFEKSDSDYIFEIEKNIALIKHDTTPTTENPQSPKPPKNVILK